jgi:hypothetical protein
VTRCASTLLALPARKTVSARKVESRCIIAT